MTQTSRDTPGVIVFPPLIPLSVLVAGLVLNFLIPLGLLVRVHLLGRIVMGGIAFLAGIGTAIGAIGMFRRVGTPARPSQPTLALATTGGSPGREIRCTSVVAWCCSASQSGSPSIGSYCSW